MRRAPPLLVLLLLLTACGGPRQPAMPYRLAASWVMPMTVRVEQTWDLVKRRVEVDNPAITHVVEVTVLQAPAPVPGKPTINEGEVLVLPYDAYVSGEDPPARGEVLTVAPAQWVNGNAGARGAPGRAWGR